MRSNARADIHDGQELKGSISRPDTEAQDQLLKIIIFDLQRAAGPYRWANARYSMCFQCIKWVMTPRWRRSHFDCIGLLII